MARLGSTTFFVILAFVALLAGGVTAIEGANTSFPDGDFECEYPVTVTDATGTPVSIETPPERIVALNPSDAQKAWAIEANESVVGMPVSQYTSYLPAYDGPEDITGDDGLTTSSERVVGLNPDLVLAANVTDRDTIEMLRRADIQVYHYSEATSIDDILYQVAVTGELLDSCASAETTVNEMNDQLTRIDQAASDVDRPLVYYAMGDGWTAGEGTFQHEIITRAGGENLAAHVGIDGWDVVSEEVIIEHDPDWIVYGHTWDEPPIRDGVKGTTAWERNQTVVVNAHYFSQPGPKTVDATVELIQHFHPDSYEQVESESAPDGPADDTPENVPQPGFGMGVALIAGIGVVSYYLSKL